LRGGEGIDTITGAAGSDDLEGGAGDDALRGNGGGDRLLGGPGTDTVFFSPPGSTEPRLSVTLDGQPNDGKPGENALVGSDVENVTFDTGFETAPLPGGNTLIGNDGPNVLIGAGTVRGLGGDDVVVGMGAQGNDLDGGDGNDRVVATVHDDFIGYVGAATIACGNGDDTVFTESLDQRPADCEHFNIGLHVAAAIAIVGPDGRAAVRVTCDDIVPCRFGNVLLRYKNHVMSEHSSRPHLTIAPGQSAVRRVRLTRGWRRPGRFHTLVVTATPSAFGLGLPGVVTAGFARVIKLIRPR
jgi:Ca2+-binding RTX toxin-like protein